MHHITFHDIPLDTQNSTRQKDMSTYALTHLRFFIPRFQFRDPPNLLFFTWGIHCTHHTQPRKSNYHIATTLTTILAHDTRRRPNTHCTNHLMGLMFRILVLWSPHFTVLCYGFTTKKKNKTKKLNETNLLSSLTSVPNKEITVQLRFTITVFSYGSVLRNSVNIIDTHRKMTW